MRLFRIFSLCLILAAGVWISTWLRTHILAEEAAPDGDPSVVATDEAAEETQAVAAPESIHRKPRPERISLAGGEQLTNEIRLVQPPSNYPQQESEDVETETGVEPALDSPPPAEPTSRPKIVETTKKSSPARPKAEIVSPSPVDRRSKPDVATESAESTGAAGTAAQEPPAEVEEPSTDERDEIQVDAASFKGVQPGQTTREQLREAWGEALEVKKLGGATKQVYKVEPFNRITATIVGDKVTSLAIHLDKPFQPEQLAEELGIDLTESVEVPDADGKLIGRSFPERGVQFGYATGLAKPLVAQIVLEPIGPQPFVLRATDRKLSLTSRALVDIDYALQLNPKDAQAHRIRAEILSVSARPVEALKSAREAVTLEPHSADAHLLVAQLLEDSGDFAEALRTIDQFLQTESPAPLEKAQAYLQWGNCLAEGPKPDYAQAMKHHMQAMKLAQSDEKQPAKIAEAKRLLCEASLAAALDIGAGRWQQKQKVVPKWIARAREAAIDLVDHHAANRELLLSADVRSLRALAQIGSPPDSTEISQRASELGHALIESATDPLRKQRLQWQLGLGMASAMQISLARSKHDQAMTYGEVAIEYLQHGNEYGLSSPAHDWVAGTLAYRLGAICAIQQNDHARALTWYAKAVPLLESPQPSCAAVDRGRQGEMFVSMAVSYWQQADKQEAVRLTEQGVKVLESAAEEGLIEKTALAIPYGNLASMHEEIGNSQQASTFAALAAKVEKQTK
jgi:tetratricopeptide (TPR) repeat protein